MRFYTKEDVRKFDSVTFLYIKASLSSHIFTITLNRPEKRNAFTPTMAEEITFALAYAHFNPEVWCVIVNASGPVFCAGADLNAFHDQSADIKNPDLPVIREEVKLGDAFAQLLKPSIAQVEGPVLAGGFLIICGCTFVVSTNVATYSLPEVKRGLWPMQVMASLMQIIPARKVLEMCITAKSYDTQEAYNVGLVTQISDKDNIANAVITLAHQILQNAPLAIQTGMKAFRDLSEIPENQRHSFLKAQLDLLLQTDDAKEGTSAFKEKRKPDWTGK
ncbi:enoyl-CoA hydratase/isomerase family protein [Dyadobacter pollutisoli]|uniref:Enoyl-CoA hydratase-related protein n=1 Tax=Dyadobacter pollutisoli TaxID=2910158 RepID=A0A9E8N9C1_9BACT|nr:enoyl-CoA hydratase-related protein [Dyadobacter pollutisoli]WAC11723.1 enoyl-CoA hydratase-related protein [Dyadobacter pollutisoli]